MCVAFSRLFAVERTETLKRGDVVEGRRVEKRRDLVDATGIEVLLSCGGARWWTYISRGEIDACGETGALRRRIVECDDHDFPRDPRTWRHTPPDAVGLWRYECGSYKIDGSPRTATYRHSETGQRVTVSSDIGADFTADVRQALAYDPRMAPKPPAAMTARGHNMLARVFRQSVDDIIRSGTHGSAEEVRETIREIAPHLALVANLPEDWRQAAGLGSRTGYDVLRSAYIETDYVKWDDDGQRRVKRNYSDTPTTHGPELDPAHLRIYRSDPGIEGAPYVRVDAPVWRLSGERVDATPPTARIDPATREANITVNMSGGLRGSAAVIAKRLREIMDRQPASARPHARTRGDSKLHGMLVDDMLTMLDQREQGPGIVHVRGIEPRPVATVGYDDPTGDDVAADWRRL